MEGSDFSFFLSSLSFSKSRCFVGDRDAFQGTDLSSRIARTRVSQGYLFVCHTPNKQHVGGLIALHRALCLVIPPQPGRFFFFFPLLSFTIQPERWGLPQWLNIMTCEPIKQLIRNCNKADDDEGEAVINPPPHPNWCEKSCSVLEQGYTAHTTGNANMNAARCLWMSQLYLQTGSDSLCLLKCAIEYRALFKNEFKEFSGCVVTRSHRGKNSTTSLWLGKISVCLVIAFFLFGNQLEEGEATSNNLKDQLQ